MLESNMRVTYLQDTFLCFPLERSKAKNTDVRYSYTSPPEAPYGFCFLLHKHVNVLL